MGACFSGSAKTAAESLAATARLSETPSSSSSTSATSATKSHGSKSSTSKRSLFSSGKPNKVPSNIIGRPFRELEKEYSLGKELGRGLYGVTRLARHLKTGTEYACKSINKRRLTLKNFENIQREAAILEHVTGHPNIAALIDIFEDEVCVHFVLELCSGGMLYDSITARGHYSEQDAARILRSMAQIVAHLHAKGVIHRDLKLENFLLASPAEDAPLKAIDFGLSTFFAPGEKFSSIVGSAYYVAPEVLEKNYGKECDVWSMGVILYMLLCGVPPFWDVSEAGICEAVLRGEYDMSSEPWSEISPSAKDLVRRMMERDVAKRITCEEILDHAWLREIRAAALEE